MLIVLIVSYIALGSLVGLCLWILLMPRQTPLISLVAALLLGAAVVTIVALTQTYMPLLNPP